MLKAKKIEEGNGASSLAQFMSEYSAGMDVFPLELTRLDDAPLEWNFYRPLPEDKFFELVESIEEKGLFSPLIVWEQPNGRYRILSGHNRRRALALLYEKTGEPRYAKAQCIVKRADELTEEEALALLVDANWVQRTLSASEKAKSILHKYTTLGRKKKDEGSGRTYDRVAQHFGLKATQVYQYIRLAALEEHWLRCVDTGELSIKAASYLVDQSPEEREALWRSGCTTTRAVRAWEKSQRQSAPQAEVPVREIRMLVPADRYEEICAMIQRYIDESGRIEVTDVTSET